MIKLKYLMVQILVKTGPWILCMLLCTLQLALYHYQIEPVAPMEKVSLLMSQLIVPKVFVAFSVGENMN